MIQWNGIRMGLGGKPDVLKGEPDIDLKRRTLVGDTADSLAIRGFSGNRILLNINGRPVNASGVVGGYYIDWGTIPLDNIEKIEIIRGGSSVRYGNNALGGVVSCIKTMRIATRRITRQAKLTPLMKMVSWSWSVKWNPTGPTAVRPS
ncbi:hypothetical protein DESC_580061 [Desulfosarcina cetonica]|nr:hypothetical protein DESC_580061 [Desulfosarcina cetonica]